MHYCMKFELTWPRGEGPVGYSVEDCNTISVIYLIFRYSLKPSVSLVALRRAAISVSKNLPSGREKSMYAVPFGRIVGESSLPHSVSF